MSPKKTDTIKQRAIYVYLPSHEMIAYWKKKAKDANVSISKFVQEHVENSLRQEEEDDFQPRTILIKRIKDLEEQVSYLEKENNKYTLLTDRLDKELRHYRAQPFIDSPEMDKRYYDKRLIKLLREKTEINENDIYVSLNLDAKDTELVTGIYKQLEELEKFGLVEALANGWRWIG